MTNHLNGLCLNLSPNLPSRKESQATIFNRLLKYHRGGTFSCQLAANRSLGFRCRSGLRAIHLSALSSSQMLPPTVFIGSMTWRNETSISVVVISGEMIRLWESNRVSA